jgi:hypothetical protein
MMERIRKFSRKACQYVCAYYKVAKEKGKLKVW